MRSTNRTDDIFGSNVGSLKKAPATNRISNPLSPEYAIPGARETGGEYGKTAVNPFQKTIQQKTAEQTLQRNPIESMPEHRQVEFKKNYAEFYGVNQRDTQKMDYNKLYQASRENRVIQPTIPEQVKAHPDFKHNQKKFWGVDSVSDTSSSYNRAVNKFFGETGQPKAV